MTEADPAILPLKRTLELNTRLLLNAIDGLSGADVLDRPTGKGPTNHIAFLVCHLVDARHYLLQELGRESESPFKGALENAKRIDDVPEFPTLEAMRAAWMSVSAELIAHLDRLDGAALAKPAKAKFPMEGGDTLLGALCFLVQHDTYHLGQIAMVRRFLGCEAMSYA